MSSDDDSGLAGDFIMAYATCLVMILPGILLIALIAYGIWKVI